ncbi:MAG: sigma 54-interacting transcriptional regulator [Gemmatimonadales bacterium]|nr:sigma 54-interacting transcriptional regulator [Gemmatimonadales bacterium]
MPAHIDTAIVGESAALRERIALAYRVAGTRLPVLLVGETGTGKELFAQEIHRWSRRKGPCIDVNCGALPRDVAESVLFGHRRGAFTGAVDHATGLIEDAANGTLFLDELDSMPTEAQSKLLRVVETGEVRRIGETIKRRVDFRVVAAVQDLGGDRSELMALRLDLLQRLAGAIIDLPPLRARDGDAWLLAEAFAGRDGTSLAPDCEPVIRSYWWPGNVRELRLTIARAVALTDGGPLRGRALAESIAQGASLVSGSGRSIAIPTPGPVTPKERLIDVCAANGWQAERIARALGVGRTTLFKQFRTLGLSLRRERVSLENRGAKLNSTVADWRSRGSSEWSSRGPGLVEPGVDATVMTVAGSLNVHRHGGDI